MVKIYFDEDADLKYLEGKTIAIIGYGIQGRAQALNLRDSNINVIVGLRPEGNSWKIAEKDGFKPLSIEEAAEKGDIIHILIPDMAQPLIYKTHIAKHLKKGKVLGFSHGFNIHYKQIIPPSDVDVIMVAPKSPGTRLREMYLQGFGVPALLAVAQDVSGEAKHIALAMAKGLGCTKAGVIETTFKDETESDLIGEQIVLVGGLMELIKKGFEVLVEAGYPPELSYFEACNEAKLIMDLIYEKGITGMLKGVSETARYGGLTIGPKVIDEHVKETMKKVVKDVQSGKFAEEWIKTSKENPQILEEKISLIENHEIELVGKKIRKMSGIEK